MFQIDHFFTAMKERGASDLHMAVGFPPMLRVRGELVPLPDLPPVQGPDKMGRTTGP